MSNQARRTGLIAEKVGMTQIFTNDGKALAVTLLKADTNFVVSQKTQGTDGYNALVLGFGERKASRVSKSVKGIFAKSGVKPAKVVREFRVSENALVPAGSELSIEHFVLNQFVDIHGVNTGKGFAGGMKRWNFRGLEATHGVSVSHRSHGSTGQRQDPGRTFKGKKMAGHMGCETVTIQNLKIVMIDPELGLIAIHGSVPGKRGTIVTITDSIKLAMPAAAMFPANVVAKAAPAAKVEAPAQEAAAESENKQDNQ